MIALDTNVVVRVLAGDDPAQTKKAEIIFAKHANADGVFVSLVVLAEVAWVLDAAYRWERKVIYDRISQLVRTRGTVVEDLELVEMALESYRAGKSGLADYLIVGKAKSVGAKLVTFDKRLACEDDDIGLL